MHYDPVTPVDNIFNKVEDLLEYGDLAKPFSQPQAIAKAYNLINATGKFCEAVKAQTRLPAIQKTWINFTTQHFRDAHLELTETGQLTLEEAGYGQANLVEDIVSRLQAEMLHHANMMNEHQPPTDAPPAAVPPPNTVNHTTTTDTFLQQLITQNQEMMRVIAANTNTSNPRGTPRNPHGVSTAPRTGQPFRPIPARLDKYCWTHGRCNHKGSACNSKAPGHKDEATMTNKMEGSVYGCT